MLYKAVVVVFDTGSHRARPLYMIGYGLSLMICIITVVAGVLVVPYRHVVWIPILLILILICTLCTVFFFDDFSAIASKYLPKF